MIRDNIKYDINQFNLVLQISVFITFFFISDTIIANDINPNILLVFLLRNPHL